MVSNSGSKTSMVIGWPIIFAGMAAMAVMAAVGSMASSEEPAAPWFILGIAVLVAAMVLLFSRLTVTASADAIHANLGGLVSWKYRYEELAEARLMKVPWYTGWGWRLGWRTNYYRLNGWYGVQLRFKDRKRHTFLEVKDAEAMVDYINSRIGK